MDRHDLLCVALEHAQRPTCVVCKPKIPELYRSIPTSRYDLVFMLLAPTRVKQPVWPIKSGDTTQPPTGDVKMSSVNLTTMWNTNQCKNICKYHSSDFKKSSDWSTAHRVLSDMRPPGSSCRIESWPAPVGGSVGVVSLQCLSLRTCDVHTSFRTSLPTACPKAEIGRYTMGTFLLARDNQLCWPDKGADAQPPSVITDK